MVAWFSFRALEGDQGHLPLSGGPINSLRDLKLGIAEDPTPLDKSPTFGVVDSNFIPNRA